MSLNARERQTLRRTARELAGSAPDLMILIAVFNMLESGTAMPDRETAARNFFASFRTGLGSRRKLTVAVLVLAGAALVVIAMGLSFANHSTVNIHQNYSRFTGGRPP